MSAKNQPFGDPVPVAGDIGYQIYSRVYNEKRRFSARVGKLWAKAPEEIYVIPEFDLYNVDEYRKAVTAAKKHLEQCKAQVFESEARVANEDYVAAHSATPTGKAPGTVGPVWSK